LDHANDTMGSIDDVCMKVAVASLLSSALLSACAAEPAAAPLPALMIDPDRVAVAGLSSGAYMATQAHLAFADRIDGAALVAGGPYGCAGGKLEQALGPCMKATPQPPDVAALAAIVRERAGRGELAAPKHLSGDRVLVLRGTLDEVVAAEVVVATSALYRRLGSALAEPAVITSDTERAFGHTFPTLAAGGACAATEAPFLGRCDFDAAGQVFELMFDATGPAADAAAGELRRFDQRGYAAAGHDPQLADEGFVYVPAACAGGGACGLLTVFHGCEQNADSVGEAFVRDAGFNRWADRASVVVLYPQTRASYVPLNPKGCWDWWGYTGPDYDTRSGAQLQWLEAAMTALGLPAAEAGGSSSPPVGATVSRPL